MSGENLTGRPCLGPAYYDASLDRVEKPLESSPWIDLYHLVLTMLPPPDPGIADIGCGSGRFAKLLQLHGYKSYWGVDFSANRIALATSYVPDFCFEVGDIFDARIQAEFTRYKVFVIVDVLEHLENDRQLIASLPSGSSVIIGVPNFDSKAHVRYFLNHDDVIQRYGAYVDFSDRMFLTNIRVERPENRIFLIKGIVR